MGFKNYLSKVKSLSVPRQLLLIAVVFGIGGLIYTAFSNALYVREPIVGVGNKCLQNKANLKEAGNPVILQDCNGSWAQSWTINSSGTIANANSYCLSAMNPSEGSAVTIEQCKAKDFQKWDVDMAKHSITNRATGLCLDTQYSKSDSKTPIVTHTCNQTASQMWTPYALVLPPTINSFNASPSTIDAGQQSTLSWDTSNTKDCSVTPDGLTDSTLSVWTTPELSEAGTVTYTLKCRNEKNEYTSNTVSVRVNPVATATFKLFSPGWRGLGTLGNSAANIFPVIFGHQDPVELHTVNPKVASYKYTLGPYVTSEYVPCNMLSSTYKSNASYKVYVDKSCSSSNTKALASSAIAKDSNGKAIWSGGFPNNFLLVPDDPATLKYVTEHTKQIMQYKDGAIYDGIISDSMGTAPIKTNYLVARPINPNTKQQYSETEWLAAEQKFLQAKRDGMPEGAKLTMNGLADGNRYWGANGSNINTTPRALFDKVDGVMAELVFRGPTTPIDEWQSPAEWIKDVRMIEDVENTYKLKGYWWSKCWSRDVSSKPETCEDDAGRDKYIPQWRRFTVASYLLGAGPNSYFNYDTYKDDEDAAEYPSDAASDYNHAKALGAARAARYPSGETLQANEPYQRDFSNGRVIVNPNHTSISVDLGSGRYKNFDGTVLSGKVTMPADTGYVLVKL